MAKLGIYLDVRKISSAGAQLKIRLSFRNSTAYYPLGISIDPEYWDIKTQKVVRHPQRIMLNSMLSVKLSEWERALIEKTQSGEARLAKDANDLMGILLMEIFPEPVTKIPRFLPRYIGYMNTRNTEGTRGVYAQTLSRMEDFDPDLSIRTFDDINVAWLRDFERFLSKTSKSANARAIHLRNIRAVFNDALNDEVTTSYPFRKFQIKLTPTRKRSLTAEQLRRLRDYPCEEFLEIYRDMFMLCFYLIGINAVDLLNATKEAVNNGRLEYIRAKTGKMYSIKIEPEARLLLTKYRGDKHLVRILDEVKSYQDWLRRMDRSLKKIGETRRVGRGGKKHIVSAFPDISQYWCRHTWATIAADLDIPKETIAAALGHGGNSVTDIYINFDRKKIDEANRKVLDYIKGEGEPQPSLSHRSK